MDSKENRCEKRQQQRGGGVRPALGSIRTIHSPGFLNVECPMQSFWPLASRNVTANWHRRRVCRMVLEKQIHWLVDRHKGLDEKSRRNNRRRPEQAGRKNAEKKKAWIQFRKVTFGSWKAIITEPTSWFKNGAVHLKQDNETIRTIYDTIVYETYKKTYKHAEVHWKKNEKHQTLCCVYRY